MANKNSGKESGKGKKDNLTRNLVIGMVVLVIAVMGGLTVASHQSSSKATVPSSVSKADGYGIVFNPSASPQIDIWEDFQCPICQHFEALNNSTINQVARSGLAKVVFHPMSFIGAESVLAANAAACAADQGKYLEMHEALYANQASSENSGKFTNNFLTALGDSTGITSKTFASCVANGKYLDWTKNIEADAAKHNVTGTPTVFINGKEINRNTQYMDPAAFKKALTDAGVKL